MTPAAGFSAHTVPVLDSTMHYVESGRGDPIVFLHGNPTSHYLWRNVMPRLAGEGRLVAPDLIGMGRSGRPDIAYAVADHERFLDAWFDALALDRVTLVIHDWGSALGISWARRHPERVRGIAMMEAIVRGMEFSEWDPKLAEVFRGFRTPGVGEQMILEQNLFIEAVLPGAVVRKLSEEEMRAYREPHPTPDSRRPILAFPRQLPIGGEPKSAMALMEANERWLATSDTPKLLLTFDPGILVTAEVAKWCGERFRHLETEHVGPGIHYVQEDHPESIGDRIKAWRKRSGVAA
jgi:haloalkane dehalogenase